MPKKRPSDTAARPNLFFADELRGENPPSFSAMEELYGMSGDFLALRPWELLEEDQLILVRHPEKDELCYCSIMGSAGEVFQMHAYIGAESYRSFRRLSEGVETDPVEFLASVTSVSVEYVPKGELEASDRKLLTAMGHPTGRGVIAPMFRAIRPGYHPWFVTSEEAGILAACLRAVVALCSEVARSGAASYWSQPNVYPLFIPDGDSWRIEQFEPEVPAPAPFPPAHVEPEELAKLRGRDYAVRGIIELDCFPTMVAVGKRNERKACSAIALAVDAESGMILRPELASPATPAGGMAAKLLIGVIRSSEAFPAEVRVRDSRLRDSLLPLAESLGLSIRLVRRLPALEEARDGMLRFFAG